MSYKTTHSPDQESLKIIKKRIKRSFFTETPVSAILKVVYNIELDSCIEKPTMQRIEDEIHAMFIEELRRGAQLWGHNIIIDFEETTPASNYYTTRSRCLDYVKTLAMNSIIKCCNQKAQRILENRGVTGVGTVNFLLSSPLDYDAFWERTCQNC